jgi:KUP system potassium uptake protein
VDSIRNKHSKQGKAALALAALGVVYGDIGTSPLYTMKEIFTGSGGVPVTPENIIGAVSVIFWMLMFIVTLKYVMLVLKADNRGEGGIMALLALASTTVADRPKLRQRLLLLGTFGACLFYGDSVLTPAISVLSAVEGLEIATPAFKPWVLPISAVILIGLFLVQRVGTAVVGRWFGPVMVVWFLLLAGVGIAQIAQAPQILQALDPRMAVQFLLGRGWGLFLAMGAVVLALTGAEALYADMGHFGKNAIRIAWMGLVLPCLALNYMGQGALLLVHPEAAANPFYLMFPAAVLLPAVAVATLATIIASQAVISGAYSLTQQAIQLGYLPRMRIVHTSASEKGQIYVPSVNWFLLVAVLAAVFGFGSSTAMASAYGIAVTATMLITTVLTYFVVRHAWGYPAWVSVASTLIFVVVDALLVASCSIKIVEGGWFPLALAGLFLFIMTTWKQGRELLSRALRADQPELPSFAQALAADEQVTRVARTAVYLSSEPGVVPNALLHNMKHNLVIHERNIVVNVVFHEEPWIGFAHRVAVETLVPGFWQVTLNFGFMNQPNIPKALALCGSHGLEIDAMCTSFFLSRETVVPNRGSEMALWRENLFEAMSRNAGLAVDYFHIPHNAVIELGSRVRI